MHPPDPLIKDGPVSPELVNSPNQSRANHAVCAGSRLSRVRDPSTTQLRKPSSIIGKSSVPAQTPTLSQPASPHHVHALSRQRSRFDVTEANNSAKTPTSTATASQSFFGGIDQYVPVNGIEALEGKPPPSLPGDLLDVTHSAAEMLSQPALVVVRQIEMMNVLLGYEQVRRYCWNSRQLLSIRHFRLIDTGSSTLKVRMWDT